MTLDFRNAPVKRFLEDLASDSPFPGGGAAAALTASAGAALVEMTARLNDVRARKASPTLKASKTVAAALKARRRFETLMRLDAEAYGAFLKTMKAGKASARYQAALKKSAAVPFEIGVLSLATLKAARRETPRTSRWLASDLAEAGILLEAAVRSARLNVEANLSGVSDPGFAARARRKLDAMEKEAKRLAAALSGSGR